MLEYEAADNEFRIQAKLWLGLYLLLVLGCGSDLDPNSPLNSRLDSETDFQIALTGLEVCRHGDHFTRIPVEAIAGTSNLLQGDERPIDLHLWLPGESVLHFGLEPGVDLKSLGISLFSRKQGMTSLAPTVSSPDTPNRFEVDLGGFDGQLVRLRFENRSGKSVSWLDPHVRGHRAWLPPMLEIDSSTRNQRLNIVVYVVDTLRADRLSLYGYPLATSPRLEEFAARGVVFAQSYSTGPHTATSIPSLLTSVVPSRVEGRLRRVDDFVAHTIPELFRDAGYSTAGFQANFMLKRFLGYGRGFDTFHVFARKQDHEHRHATADEVHTKAIDWLKQESTQPFFLFVQTIDVHNPYAAPEPFLGRFSDEYEGPAPEMTYFPEDIDKWFRDATREAVRKLTPQNYDDGVSYADHAFGDFVNRLDELGLRDSTAIFFTADHGESLGEGGRYLHGFSLNEELIHVPLVIVIPGMKETLRIATPVSLLDLGPTLTDLAGIDTPAQFEGRSWLAPRAANDPSLVLGERISGAGFQEWFVREGDWKLIASRQSARLYRIPEDPEESRNLAEQYPLLRDYLMGRLWAASPAFQSEKFEAPAVDRGLDALQTQDHEDALRALGYIE